jgi:glycosyltransferase involved in cell wall biosynthesis/SAM-dependent methyltransferase
MDVCTIIAKNYLAAARVLARSLADHHPDAACHVLVIDEIEGYFDPDDEDFRVLTPESLEIERFEWMAGIYDVLELSTAVKPWLMRHLLEDSDGVVYLDPDVRLYAPIDDVFAAVAEHGLVLNPHNVDPMPRDGRKPTEQDILIAGAYNLGFLGLRADESSSFLLDWWAERLESDCIVDPQRGFFVDQRWMDFAPSLTRDFHLVRDPGFNVAYWNLPTRELARENGRYEVNGEPLRLFHFSGFDPARPHVLSRHQDRIRLPDEPALAELCDGYRRALLEAGHEDVSRWPYSYAQTASGIRLDRTLRTAYRRASEDIPDLSLFNPEGERRFLAWCNEPAENGGAYGVTRYLEVLYEGRGDLQVVYGDLEDEGDALGFLGWVHHYGRGEMSLPDGLVPEAGREMAQFASRPPAPAVNVAGYLHAELGVGEVARQIVGSLDAAGVPLIPVGLHAPGSRQSHDYAVRGIEDAAFDVNVICVNADGLPRFAREAGPRFFEGRFSIGVWWWELAQFPERFHGSFSHLDEIWAGSRFVADAVSGVAPIPVVHMPLPLTLPEGVAPDRERFDLPPGFVFLFAFDFNSVFKRKNPLGLIEAFVKAFDPGEDVHLVVKSINAERFPDERDRLRMAAAPHPHVHLMEGYLARDDTYRLTASCDAVASLHRSEGFGLGLAEALLLGRPVVATDYGGSTDFVDESTGYPVRWTPVEVGGDAYPYDADATWAEPDLEHAAQLLRRVVERPREASERAQRGQEVLRERHSPRAAGERMRERLEAIAERRGGRALSVDGLGIDPPVGPEEVAERVAHPPAPEGGGPRSRLRGAARRAVLRAIKPYTANARAVDVQLAELLREERRVTALEHARLLAQLRRALPAGSDATDDLRAEVERLRRRVEDQERLLWGDRAADARVAHEMVSVAIEEYPPAPDDEPWSEAYTIAHRAFLSRALDDAALLAAFRDAAALPTAYGVRFDERVVELPWVAAQRLSGDVLDAGSSLNHAHVLARLRPRMDRLDIVTLAPEEQSFPQLGVSYLYADLRDLPIRDERYDRVVCVSTLDHVGLELSHFEATAETVEDPRPEVLRALAELRRVLRPGGDLYLTLPVGSGERFAWVRSFTPAELDALVEAFEPAESSVGFYAQGPEGWRRAERDEVADARYRDHFSSGPVRADGVVAAGAVACLHLVR